MAVVTRFAPSPTGPLHLGHAYSALLAHDMARAAGGSFLLRIEDIDRQRSKARWEQQLYDDLRWLGLSWDAEPMRQSGRQPAYAAALDRLWQAGLLYPCTCSRKDVEAALSAPQEGAALPTGPDGLIYPGTCRPRLPPAPSAPRPPQMTLRLALAQVPLRAPGPVPTFGYQETGPGLSDSQGGIAFTLHSMQAEVGDVVLARKDMGTSYHLSVVVDDAAQGITHVVRGADLAEATRIHVLLQHLLGLPTPSYHHHRLIRDETGKRLAKRDDARAIALYRSEGATPADIRRMVGL